MSDDGLAWDLAGIPVVIVGGMLLHFCFDSGGRRPVLAVFCPINESVWEHLKMAYWPLVAFTAVTVVSDGPGAAWAGSMGMVLPVAIFALTTFAPPHADVFRDQMTGGYGLAAGEHPGPGQAH